MKKLMILAAMLAMVVVAAVPALAASNGNGNDWWNNNNNNNPNWWNNNNNNNPNWWNNNNNNNPFDPNGDGGVSQSNEQDVQSGDSSQTFTVTGGGDNSNACQGIQGVSNTGNSANNTGVLQYGSNGGGIETSGGDFTINPSSTTTCNQQVNQAASASGN